MRDIHNHISVVQALETIVVNNDTEGTGATIDLKGFEAAEMIVDVGQSGDVLSGSVFHTIKLQHGDLANGTDMADVALADMLGGVSAGVIALIDDPAEDGVVVTCGYRGSKRYIRVFVDTTGTHTNGTPIGAVCVKAKGRHLGGNAA